MKQDPENGKDAAPGAPVGAGGPSLLAGHRALMDRLFSESGAASWNLPRERFDAALERSAKKQFASVAPRPAQLEEYLGALHVQDLALACACAEARVDADGDSRIDSGSGAWDHFVGTYRAYLRSAAAAILRCPANSPAACELADSLFADLYGVSAGKRAELSLFRYFHGRSSLKTWLRAILAQRHIDAIRADRRFTELEDGDDGGLGSSRTATLASRLDLRAHADPHRDRYVSLLTAAFERALAQLDPRDLDRLRMYYSEEQTLAEIGRVLGEHESSVSRNLDRIRRDLRRAVEIALRKDSVPVNGSAAEPGLSDAQIALCFGYASEDAPIDLDKLLPRSAAAPPKPARPGS
jgi:RNA polymerase sigma factor (sigma-70 family)